MKKFLKQSVKKAKVLVWGGLPLITLLLAPTIVAHDEATLNHADVVDQHKEILIQDRIDGGSYERQRMGLGKRVAISVGGGGLIASTFLLALPVIAENIEKGKEEVERAYNREAYFGPEGEEWRNSQYNK